MFSLIYAWINDWVNNREAGDLRRQHGHYDVIVMWSVILPKRTNNTENISTSQPLMQVSQYQAMRLGLERKVHKCLKHSQFN